MFVLRQGHCPSSEAGVQGTAGWEELDESAGLIDQLCKQDHSANNSSYSFLKPPRVIFRWSKSQFRTEFILNKLGFKVN